MNRISWEITVDQPGFETILLTNSRIHDDVAEAVEQVQVSISNGFNLSKLAQEGLSRRINSLHAYLRDGCEGQEGTSLPIGALSVSNVVGLNGKFVPDEKKQLPSKIYLTLDSYKEEIENLHEASKEYSNETAFDENSTGVEVMIAQFADDHESLVSEAIKLAISRRLLKYGIVPSGVLNDTMAETIGFTTWFDQLIADKTNFGDLSKAKQKKLLNASRELYLKKDIAVRNIRKTIWPKIFHSFVPFNPETNQVFYTYYLNKLVSNSKHTIIFSDELSTRIPQEEVADALEKIYAPGSFALRSV